MNMRKTLTLCFLLILTIQIDCLGQQQLEQDLDEFIGLLVEGDSLKIRSAVDKGVNLKLMDYPQFDALNYFVAVEMDDEMGMELLYKQGVYPEIQLGTETPLIRAIKQDKFAITKWLMKNSHLKSKFYSESLLNFVKSRDMFKFLRSEDQLPDNNTPFHLVDVNLPIALRTMLAKGECSKESKNVDGVTLYDYAVKNDAKDILESFAIFYEEETDQK